MRLAGVGSSVGTIFLLLGLRGVYKEIKRRNKIKLIKKKFFEQNGGLLLQKQLSLGEEGNVEKCKLFTSKDLEKATDRYNKNRIIGQGGQGTVYKGMLIDGRIVTDKVSAKLDEDNLEQFVNEYIHEKNKEFPLSWDVRLRIAIEGPLDTWTQSTSVWKEGKKEEITMVVDIAKRCLNLSGRKRPTMRDVMKELEGIRIPNGGSGINELDEEGEYDIIEVFVPSETSSTSRACPNSHLLLIE
ncbi:hypothetical protein LguiA_026297 [Lonicera macranthoides]